MNIREPVALGARERGRLRIVPHLTVHNDLGTEATNVFDLLPRCALRHEYHRRHAGAPAGVRNGRAVVAARCGDDATHIAGFRQARSRVGGTACFERSGDLKVLELQQRFPVS